MKHGTRPWAEFAPPVFLLFLILIAFFLPFDGGAIPQKASCDPLTPGNDKADSCKDCFPGAYYHKVSTSLADWHGIETVIKLGTPETDPSRFNQGTNWSFDGFNVYVGGNAGGQEIDAGLTWGPVVDANGNWVGNGAFHPFWRNGAWNETPPSNRQYWYPGEIVKISIRVAGSGRLRLMVSDVGPNPKRVFVQEFPAASFGVGLPTSFKRVNDVAQHGNEGKPVIPTTSQVTDAVWQETYLLRLVNAVVERVPATPSNTHVLNCPSTGHVRAATTPALAATGGEIVSVFGTPQATPSPAPLPSPAASPEHIQG
jgi:hypothetical protein